MHRIDVGDLDRDLRGVLEGVERTRRPLLVTREGRVVAEITPVSGGRRLGDLPGILRRLPRLGAAEAGPMADDIERGRRWIGSPRSRPTS